MNRLPLIAFAFAAVGCYNEDKFGDDYLSAMCDKTVECEVEIVGFYTTSGLDEATAQSSYDTYYEALCETEAVETDDPESDCEFDAGAAKDCVSGVEDAACEEAATGFTMPDVCADVCG